MKIIKILGGKKKLYVPHTWLSGDVLMRVNKITILANVLWEQANISSSEHWL